MTTEETAKPATVTDAARLAASNPLIVERLRAEIDGKGPITIARFMARALYEPEIGYYQASERRPGRGGDFITAPETHPFFGFTLARQVFECWERLERPSPFTIREYGPGVGGLAYDILAAIDTYHPELFPHVRYRLADVNPHRMTDALDAMRDVGLEDIVSRENPSDAASDPIVGVVIANELVDALPVHQLVVHDGKLWERFVGWDVSAGWFTFVEGPLSTELAASDPEGYLTRVGIDVATLPEGALLEMCPAAAIWMRDVALGIARGYALIVDYGYPAAELYSGHRLHGLLRGYREHTVTDDPLVAIGEQDLTAHVDFTGLENAAIAAGMTVVGLTTQADALVSLGLGDLLVEMQQQPDVELESYYQTQAAVLRLIDPGGMGRFRLLGLAKDAPTSPPLRVFVPAPLM